MAESKKNMKIFKAKLVKILSRFEENLGLCMKTIHLNPKPLKNIQKNGTPQKFIIDGLVLFEIILKKDKKKDFWLTSMFPRLFI